MADLTAADRDDMSSDEFAEPKKRAYPVNDKSHAKNALARVSQFGSPSLIKKVKAKVSAKFPSIIQKSPLAKKSPMKKG